MFWPLLLSVAHDTHTVAHDTHTVAHDTTHCCSRYHTLLLTIPHTVAHDTTYCCSRYHILLLTTHILLLTTHILLFQEYAETAMNELLGWYGYDKLDSRDTQGLNLHHFAAQRSPSDLDSSDAEGARSSSSPGRRDAGTGSSQGSPPLPGKLLTRK